MTSFIFILIITVFLCIAFSSWWPFLILLFIFAFTWFCIGMAKRRERLEREEQTSRMMSACRSYGVESIASMSGLQFEQFVGELLKRNGFSDVTVTRGSGDFGVDVVATKFGDKYAFQCKHYAGTVGVASVQQVFAGARMYGAKVSIVVTNSTFTPAAIKMAKEIGVQLWDKNKLLSMMR